MGQKRQGGSTIVYLLVGAMLVAGLVGGVYALRQVTAQKPAVAQLPQDEKKEQEQQTEKPEQNQGAQPTEDTSTPEASMTNPSDTPQRQNEVTAPPREEQAPTNEHTELPRTGASDIGSWAALGVLIAVGTAYVRSRRFTLT